MTIDMMHDATKFGGAILFSSLGSNATVNNLHLHYVEGLSPWFLRPETDQNSAPLRIRSYAPCDSWGSIHFAQEHDLAHCVLYFRGQVHVCTRQKQGYYDAPERTTDLAALECLVGRFVAKSAQDLLLASTNELAEYIARVAIR